MLLLSSVMQLQQRPLALVHEITVPVLLEIDILNGNFGQCCFFHLNGQAKVIHEIKIGNCCRVLFPFFLACDVGKYVVGSTAE